MTEAATWRSVQASDRPAPGTDLAPGGTLDPTLLLGTWINTNPSARGIVRVVVTAPGGALSVRAYGAGSPEPVDWGETPARAFAADVASRTATTLSARYQFDFLAVELQAFVKLGVLVMASFNRFTDDSGRASYFAREFFYR